MKRETRHAGRMAAVQLLFQMDTCGLFDEVKRQAGELYDELLPETGPEARQFALELCLGVAGCLQELDRLLGQASEHWRVERMSRVDRSILRLAAFELTSQGGPPPPVVIDEAVRLARALGGTESPAFVNGVLARVLRELEAG